MISGAVHMNAGATVAPWIGAPLPASSNAPRMGGQTVSNGMFPSSMSNGGTSVGASHQASPAHHRESAPVFANTFNAISDGSERILNGGINGAIDTATRVGIAAGVVSSVGTQIGMSAIGAAITRQGPSFQFGQQQQEQQAGMNPGMDPAMIQALHEATYAKGLAQQAGLRMDDVTLTGANLSNIRDMTANIADARQQSQAAGFALA